MCDYTGCARPSYSTLTALVGSGGVLYASFGWHYSQYRITGNGHRFGRNPLRMQGVLIAYLITVAILIPASGWLADRFGSRKIFYMAIMLFCLGSLLCTQVNTLDSLIIARIIQAVGGALMMPVGRLVVLRAYPRSDLVRVMSFVTLPGLVGPLIGPTIGGWLVEYASWRWILPSISP